MSGQRDIRDVLTRQTVEQCERPISVPDYNVGGSGSDAHVVSVRSAIKDSDRREMVAVKPAHRSITTVRDDKRVTRHQVRDTLGTAQWPEPLGNPPRANVHDTNAVVPKFGDKDPTPHRIKSQVINPAIDFAERDPVGNDERRDRRHGAHQADAHDTACGNALHRGSKIAHRDVLPD